MTISKVIFRYGTMDSSKSMNLIASVHNYRAKGDDVMVFKPSTDSRSSSGFVESRTGIKAKCIDVNKNDSLLKCVDGAMKEGIKVSCVFIDECQFLSQKQAYELLAIADNFKISVIAYGLRTDFRGLFFPATSILMRNADKIEEIKTICHIQGCNKKATHNQRLVNGAPVFDGDLVSIGDTDSKEEISYMPKCRFHYMDSLVKEQQIKEEK